MSNVFQNPLFRYGVGVSGAAVIAAVAFLFLDPGPTRTAAFVLAGLDLVVTPFILGKVGESADDGPAGT
jgi:uncharacterized membrane protein YdcZ (DUF606 family)